MSSLPLLCFFALFAAILLQICGDISPKFKALLLCGAGIIFFFVFFQNVAPILNRMAELGESTGFPELYGVLIKALALSLLITLSASFCRDLGEEGIAAKLELCGKAAVLSLSLPLLDSLLGWLKEAVGG